MLTEIFAVRYANVKLWERFDEPERRLLVQGFRLLEEQVCPYWLNKKESEHGKAFWTELHNRLSMELGLKSLSDLGWCYPTKLNGNDCYNTGFYTLNKVCETWILQALPAFADPDCFIKERLSLVEIGFRIKASQIAYENATLEARIAQARKPQKYASGHFKVGSDYGESLRVWNEQTNSAFKATVYELNTRFKQAGCRLHYHNGFIQQASDPLITAQIEAPFWALVANPKWANVDVDMKQAIDLRDTNGRDPAFYAARALESTIKIVSAEKGWTHGKERGAHNYIDNLTSNGFIEVWECDQFKAYFTKVRNPFSHGPGDAPMPKLTPQQINWAIDFAMASIKSLIKR